MIQENLSERIQSSVDNLLRLAKIHCWNTVSGNICYIVSDFNEFDGTNVFKRRASRNRVNRFKAQLTFDAAVDILNQEYSDLYDVNLYIFKALKKQTIIEIQFYRKSNLNADYFVLVKDHPPMFHAKITIPVYAWEGGKFDVNWESGGGWHHAWKNFVFRSFLYRRKIRGKNVKNTQV